MPRFSLRTLAIVKYFPAVLCAFIAACFVISQFRYYNATFPNGRGWVFAVFSAGTVDVQWLEGRSPTNRLTISYQPAINGFSLGKLNLWYPGIWIKVPVLLPLTLLLPAAILPLARFRFPMWTWFVWAALIAAELAYLSEPFRPMWTG